MRRPSKLLIFGVLGMIGLATGFAIRSRSGAGQDEPGGQGGTEHAETEFPRGPHNGRLLSDNPFALEITIYETGVPPQLRVYPYDKGTPIDPREVTLRIELQRLGGITDRLRFIPESGYLKGDQVVYEPHSFDVQVQAEWRGKSYRWTYASYEGRVALDEEALHSAEIALHTAGPARIKTVLDLPGQIQLNENRVAHVVPRLPGVVIEVRKNLGDQVQQGEVIAVLDSRELAQARSEYIESVHRLEFAQAAFVREERLWTKRISAEQDYLLSRHRLEEAEIAKQVTEQQLLALGLSRVELERLAVEPEGEVIPHKVRAHFPEKALTRYEVTAPITGAIIERHLTIGEAVAADADILVIADLSTVWADITVYSKDLAVVKVDQPVTVRSKELQLEAEGTVSYLGPLVGEQTRSAKARVELANAEGRWRPGLFVTVTVVSEEVEVPVAVRAEAIQTYRDWSVVFAQYGNAFEIRPIEMGRSDGQWVEVLSGLEVGQRYAASNSFVLKAELGKAGATHDH